MLPTIAERADQVMDGRASDTTIRGHADGVYPPADHLAAVTPGNYGIAALVAAARELIAASDRLDGQLAARLAAHAEGYRLGAEQAAAQWQAGYNAACADLKGVQHALVDVFGELAEVQARRWHLCCVPCRRRGHRTGCRECQDRTAETWAEPMPGDYLGGPVEWLAA